MKTVDDYEVIRRAYYLEGLSIREISRQLHHGRALIRKAIQHPEPAGYQLSQSRPAPVLEPYKPKIEALLEESERLPRKQRYTAHKVYELLCQEGYTSSEGSVHNYVSQRRKGRKRREAYLPLEYDPGQDAQVDWGEATVKMAGELVKVQVFIQRLNYSRVRFVMAFPFQKQEAFFAGHVAGFHFVGGIPRRITYDNLKTAVFKVLEGRNRQEQQAFKTFRSYYLFESRYCTPAQGHEKGGVENDVGYVQRNFFSPIPDVADYAELNAHLLACCQRDIQRQVRGQAGSVASLWAAEKTYLLPLSGLDYPACTSHAVKVNPYSQVVFETNRYSVPVQYVGKQLVLRAYPFQVEILSLENIIARHPRCFGREQDILDPLHYLDLLSQRPGAFEHALPLRQWRKKWPVDYEQLLTELQKRNPEGRGVREFVSILKLHRQYPDDLVAQAIHQALAFGAASLDGVMLCLRQLQENASPLLSLDLTEHPLLASVGQQPLDLHQYDQLLGGR